MSIKEVLHDAVLGTWELQSYTIENSERGETTYPLGPDPIGLIMYTEDGYMSAQLMRGPVRGRLFRAVRGAGCPRIARRHRLSRLQRPVPCRRSHRHTAPQGDRLAVSQLARQHPAPGQSLGGRCPHPLGHQHVAQRSKINPHLAVEARAPAVSTSDYWAASIDYEQRMLCHGETARIQRTTSSTITAAVEHTIALLPRTTHGKTTDTRAARNRSTSAV
jgi:hypothetical protein